MVADIEEGALPAPGTPADESVPDFTTWESLNLADVTCGLLEEAMRRAGGNQTAAAALLGITRSSLRRRLIKFAIENEDEDESTD
jgi:DNA-binding NtrC family response regulator